MSLTSDYIEAVAILEDIDDVNKSGVKWSQAVDGDPSAGRNAGPMMVAIDQADNLRYLRLTDDNALIVSTDDPSVEACLADSAKVSGGISEQQILEISLVAGKTYRDLAYTGSCFRRAEFRIVVVDDPAGTPVETELETFLVNPNNPTHSHEKSCQSWVAPATSPVLRMYGTNVDVASDLRGTLTVKEKQ
jgi:hypothetical protein